MRSISPALSAILLLALAAPRAQARPEPGAVPDEAPVAPSAPPGGTPVPDGEAAAAPAPAVGEPGTEGFVDRPRELALSPGQQVRVEVWRGGLELRRRRGGSARLEVVRERVQDVGCQAVTVGVAPEGIEVSTGPRGAGACTERVQLRLGLPAGIRLRAAVSDGLLTADSLDGEIELLALGGELRVTGGSGRLIASAGDQDLVVKGSGAALTLTTAGGAIRVSGRAGADLTARSVSGTIALHLRELAPVRIRAETLSGDIEILYPPGPRPSLEIAPGPAGLDADFVLPERPAGEEGGWKVRAVEAGRPLLQLRTRSGRIRLLALDGGLQDLEEERGAEEADTASEKD